MMNLMTMSGAGFKRYRMDLYNAFHRARRLCRDSDYDDVKQYIPGWFDLLEKIDGCTTLEQRFMLCGTNTADQVDILKRAKKYSAPVTMYHLMEVFKGANSATWRGHSAGLRGFDRFSAYLGWYVIFGLPKGAGMALVQQFFGDSQDE
jgi:hypothetical protein